MNRTPIEWTHWSVNALKLELPNGALVNTCVHKSLGCQFCYAESIVRHFWKKEWKEQFGEFPDYTPALLKMGKPVLVEKELEAVLRLSDRIAKGKADPKENRIFWHDMTDEYLDFWPDELLDRVWAVRALTPNLIHQVLTKRPERMYQYFEDEDELRMRWGAAAGCLLDGNWIWNEGKRFRPQIEKLISASLGVDTDKDENEVEVPLLYMPLANCHLGVSCEDQKTANERLAVLLKIPAAVRWISYEPALGPVEFRHFLPWEISDGTRPSSSLSDDLLQLGVDWIVCGGESGPGARPFDIEWARNTIAQCKAAGVPCFVKQLGAKPIYCSGQWPPGSFADHSPDAGYSVGPLKLKDKKGGDWSEWPADLRVREYPA